MADSSAPPHILHKRPFALALPSSCSPWLEGSLATPTPPLHCPFAAQDRKAFLGATKALRTCDALLKVGAA